MKQNRHQVLSFKSKNETCIDINLVNQSRIMDKLLVKIDFDVIKSNFDAIHDKWYNYFDKILSI